MLPEPPRPPSKFYAPMHAPEGFGVPIADGVLVTTGSGSVTPMNRIFPAALAMLAASAAPAHGGDLRVVTKTRVHDDIGPHPTQKDAVRYDVSGSGWMNPTQLARLGRKNSRPKKMRR